jgi:hypothetical protein
MAELPFILTYTAFVAPGCGGVARLAVGLTKRGDIAVIHDLPSEYASEEDGSNILIFDPFLLDPVPRSSARGSEFRWGGTVAAVRGWRGVIEHLAANEIVAFGTDGDTDGEYPWPATMELEGEGSVASDLVAAAWSGRPVLGIAQALAGLPDDVLVGLRDRYGSLRNDDTIRPLLRIMNTANELDVPFKDIVARAPRSALRLPAPLDASRRQRIGQGHQSRESCSEEKAGLAAFTLQPEDRGHHHAVAQSEPGNVSEHPNRAEHESWIFEGISRSLCPRTRASPHRGAQD